MSLQSFAFFGFFIAVAVVYLRLPAKLQPPFLLVVSWIFYIAAQPTMFLVALGFSVFVYFCARGLTAFDGAHKTAFLRLGVIGCLALLAFFKYAGFFEKAWGLPFPPILLPLGLSFFTFASISYLIDAARGDCPVEKSFITVALFVMFFATVTSGPICRAGNLMPQLKTEHRFNSARTANALRLFALGLFKKVAVADVLALFVNQVFEAYADYTGPVLVLAAVGYTLQLYFDFCGYSEMARATGLFLGLELPENFKTPFYATNFSGFWSRWHISLSSWLQDYLFMPLAWADASRLGIAHLPAELCVFIVFFVSGFWHGNTLPFVVWGLMQGLFRMGEELMHRYLGKPKRKAPARVLWGKRAGVFALWTVSMVFFRIGSGPNPAAGALTVGDGFAYLGRCFAGWAVPGTTAGQLYQAVYTGFYQNPLMVAAWFAFVALALALALWLDALRNRAKSRPAEVVLASLRYRWVVYYLLVVFVLAGYIIQSGGFGGTSFAYAQF